MCLIARVAASTVYVVRLHWYGCILTCPYDLILHVLHSEARMATAETATAPDATFLDSVLQSIITPGAGPGLIATINGSLILLILIVAVLSILGWFDLHLVILAALSVGLLLSINWYLSMVPVPAQPAAEAEQVTDKADGTSASSSAVRASGQEGVVKRSGTGAGADDGDAGAR